ncbi:spermidine/putrescine ABC transporter ATPase [Limnochorda pilosa]|uniref:Spermidine/putrescine ABC transporter ATPase n=1 Tax=Limnochorda pilosa TaxID=1555112 RepID=A0A0K2SLD1_LIMPI|nr:spermidine/putrescine ABC transporter ATPase [Limnochorda pilosa]
MAPDAEPGALELKPAGESAATGLTIERVSKRFGDVAALRGVDLLVRGGEFFTLLGPSGCGKTTLLRIIAGLELPDSGRILLSGKDITSLPANMRPINTVFQNYALFPHLDVYENVAFGLRSRRFPVTAIKRRVEDALAMLQLDSLAGRYPHQLSGGQQQRVALARALVNEPEILLLDEPLSSLDAKLRAILQVELRRLQRRLSATFILVTHDQDEAMAVSDRIAVMQPGIMVQVGTPQEIYERPCNRYVAEFLGAANLILATSLGDVVETQFGILELNEKPSWRQRTLAIRPERVRLGLTPPAANGVRGRLREVVYRGAFVEAFFDPGQLRVRAADLYPLQEGDEVWLELPREALVVLDE